VEKREQILMIEDGTAVTRAEQIAGRARS